MLNYQYNKSARLIRNEEGATLIEILYAMFMVLVFVAGSIAYNLDSINDSAGSLYQTQASALAADMANRIRLNRDYALGNNNHYLFNSDTYKIPATEPTCHKSKTTGCDGAAIAQEDLYHWAMNFKDPGKVKDFVATIPAGKSKITRSGSRFTIEVTWDEVGFTIIGGIAKKENSTAKYTMNFSL